MEKMNQGFKKMGSVVSFEAVVLEFLPSFGDSLLHGRPPFGGIFGLNFGWRLNRFHLFFQWSRPIILAFDRKCLRFILNDPLKLFELIHLLVADGGRHLANLLFVFLLIF